MKEHHLYSFIGLERCDIVYMLSVITEKIDPDSSILVIDNSNSHDLFTSVCNNDNNIIQRGSVTYVKNKAFSEKVFSQFDYIFCYMGWNPDLELLENSNHIFVVTDYTKHCYSCLKKQVLSAFSNCSLIFRDKATNKIHEKEIAEKISLQNAPMYVFPFELKDYLMYLMLNHNGKQKIKGFTSEFKENMKAILIEIFGFDVKAVKHCL